MSESRKVSNVSQFETKKYQTHPNGPLSTRSPHSNPPHPSTRWWIVLKSGLPGPLSEPSSEPPEPLSPMPLAPAAELLSEPLESPHHGSMGRWWKNTRVSSPRLILHWIHLQQNIRPASRSRSCRKLYQLSTTKKNEQVRRTASLTQKSVIRGFGVSCTVRTSNISTSLSTHQQWISTPCKVCLSWTCGCGTAMSCGWIASLSLKWNLHLHAWHVSNQMHLVISNSHQIRSLKNIQANLRQGTVDWTFSCGFAIFSKRSTLMLCPATVWFAPWARIFST